MKRIEKIEMIMNRYGWRHQLRKLNEETYELFEAVVNYKDAASTANLVAVAEEIADCKVLTTQFMHKFGMSDKAVRRTYNIFAWRKKAGIKYSSLFLFSTYQEFAEGLLHDMNEEVGDHEWVVEKLCGYMATIETLSDELQIDTEVIEGIMDRKIDRQIERIRKEDKAR